MEVATFSAVMTVVIVDEEMTPPGAGVSKGKRVGGVPYFTGACATSAHLKQNVCPHEHVTGLAAIFGLRIAFSQPAAGHHRMCLLP